MTRPLYADRSEEIGALSAALAKCQRELRNPTPNRVSHFAKKGRDGKPEPDYADLDKIIDTIREPAAKNDLSYSFDYVPKGEGWVLCLELVHGESGQWKRSHLPFNTDARPMEQAVASTYFKRMLLCGAFCIAADRDDDGVIADNAHISAEADRTIRAKKMLTEKWAACQSDEDREKFRKGSAKTVSSGAVAQEWVDQLMNSA